MIDHLAVRFVLGLGIIAIMDILFLTPAFPPFQGGGERYVRSLALTLAAHGHRVTAVTSTAVSEVDFWRRPAGPMATENDDGITVIRCPLSGLRGGRRALLAWRKAMALLSILPGDQTAVLRRMSRFIPPIARLEDVLNRLPDTIDLVHGFNTAWEYPLMAGEALARQRQLPFVITPFLHLGEPGRPSRVAFMDHHQRLLVDADQILTLTSTAKEGLAARGIAAHKMDVIGGGLDPLPDASDIDSVVRRLEMQRPFLLFIGRASYDKGALTAVQAVRHLRHRGYAATLALVGTIPPEFERIYRRLGEDEKTWIRPLGPLDDNDKHALLSACRLLILPSRTDSFGIVLLEAWAHGKPVIGARAGGIPGVISEGNDGLLVTFGDAAALADAIARLWADDGLRAEMGRRGQEKTARQFTWEQVGARVLQNYGRLAGNGRRQEPTNR